MISNYCWLCPLLLFDCDINDVELAESIHIIPLPTAFSDYINRNNLGTILEAKYAAILPYSSIPDQQPGFNREVTKIESLLFDLITSFRLCHAGLAAPGSLELARLEGSELHLPQRQDPSFRGIHTELSMGADNILVLDLSMGNKYKLGYSDIAQVNTLMKEIRSHRASNKFGVLHEAMRKFNSAYFGELEDRLIDQMVAFESLFIGDDKELGYKLAVRVAFLLGRRRKQTFSDMKRAYALRGQIVHGNKQVERNRLKEIIPKMEEYLRQSIRRFVALLSQGTSLKEIRERLLDENILTNGKSLSLPDRF